MKNWYCLLALGLIQQAPAQTQPATSFVREQYQKAEYKVPMRDGTNLHTTVYVPKDASATNKYPLLMQRTCYSVAPYGPDAYPNQVGPSATLMRDKYIVVYQDVRGRWASEGTWTNMTPVITDQQPVVATTKKEKHPPGSRQRPSMKVPTPTIPSNGCSKTYPTITVG